MCTASTAKELADWLLNWTSMATILATPVVEDGNARAILHSLPEIEFTPCLVPSDPWAVVDGESLYAISYDFGRDRRNVSSFFPTVEDRTEYRLRPIRLLGRWHDLASGTGLIVCASTSSKDLQSWISRWMHLCSFEIRPVVTDSDLRDLVTSKPDFDRKHKHLMATLKPFWRCFCL